MLGYRCKISRVGGKIDGIIIEDAFAVILGDNVHRRLAFAEARNTEAAGILFE